MKDENFILKMPNWLRYLLAFPLSFLSIIPIDIIIAISNWLYSDTNSNWYQISNFLVANVVNIIVFFFALTYILPKYKFGVTLTINSLLILLIIIILINNIFNLTLNLKDFIGIILNIFACIFSCIYSYKIKDNEEEKQTLYDKFPKVLPSYSNTKKLTNLYLKNLMCIIENQKLFGKINPYTNEVIEDYEDIKKYYKQYLNDKAYEVEHKEYDNYYE